MSKLDSPLSLEDLPDHVLDSIFKSVASHGSAPLKCLRVASTSINQLSSILITKLTVNFGAGPTLSSVHLRFPCLQQITIESHVESIQRSSNEGLERIQQAFASFWTEERVETSGNLASVSSDDDESEAPSQLFFMFLTESLPHLTRLTSLILVGSVTDEDLRALVKNLPSACANLTLPHSDLRYERLDGLCDERTNLSIHLTGQRTVNDTIALAGLTSIGTRCPLN